MQNFWKHSGFPSSVASVTHNQPWSETIIWKIPEKKCLRLSREQFWIAGKSRTIWICPALDTNHPFVQGLTGAYAACQLVT